MLERNVLAAASGVKHDLFPDPLPTPGHAPDVNAQDQHAELPGRDAVDAARDQPEDRAKPDQGAPPDLAR